MTSSPDHPNSRGERRERSIVRAADVQERVQSSSGITQAVAQYVASVVFEDLPAAVVQKAKNIVLDALGGQLACTTLPHGRIAIEYAKFHSGRSDATVIGTDFRTGVEHAAFVNGIQGHGDEIDESLLGFGHASAVLVPAVLAVGEREKASGRDLITALVVGYDVAARLAKAGFSLDVLAPRNWQQGSTAGSIAAAAAAARLLGLASDLVRAALAIGAEQSCGLQSMRTETGHMHKSLHMGVGSRNGVAAAYLAQLGYGGVPSVLDPPYSVFEAFIPDAARPEEMTIELGRRFDILASRFKRYSAGSPTHSAIATVLGIMDEQGLVASDIEHIHVRVPTLEQGLLSKSLTLNINFEYIIAVAAMDGQVSWDQYSEKRQQDAELRDLWRRVSSEGDASLDAMKDANVGARPARVTLATRDGRTFDGEMIYPPGHPRNPLTQEELEEKFMYWSTRVITRSQAEALRHTVMSLDRVTDVNELGSLLRV